MKRWTTKKIHLTEDQQFVFRQMYFEPRPIPEIAKFFNISIRTVGQIRKRLGIPARVLNKVNPEEFLADYLNGVKHRDLEVKYNITDSARVIRLLNLPRRRFRQEEILNLARMSSAKLYKRSNVRLYGVEFNELYSIAYLAIMQEWTQRNNLPRINHSWTMGYMFQIGYKACLRYYESEIRRFKREKPSEYVDIKGQVDKGFDSIKVEVSGVLKLWCNTSYTRQNMRWYPRILAALKYVEGWTDGQIAEMFKTTAPDIMNEVRRVCVRMGKHLKGTEYDNDLVKA